jgi:hypothetical protein
MLGEIATMRGWRLRLVAAVAVVAGLALAGAPRALAGVPHWQLEVTTAPTDLQPGGEGQVALTATNLGDVPVNAATEPLSLTFRLPHGVVAKRTLEYPYNYMGFETHFGEIDCKIRSESLVECSSTPGATLPSYESLEARIVVGVRADAKSGEELEATVSGGETVGVVATEPLAIGASTPFGVHEFKFVPENEDGTVQTQAGAHPFQLTTTLSFNEGLELDNGFSTPYPSESGLVKNVAIDLPPGFVGNPTPVAQCTGLDFGHLYYANIDSCPENTIVGVASVTINEPKYFAITTRAVPVFNLIPEVGEPARFGFEVLGVPVILDAGIRSGRNYGVVIDSDNTEESANLLTSRVTFWGVPGDPAHNSARGWSCLNSYLYLPCTPSAQRQPPPLLTLPTSCRGSLTATAGVESWEGELRAPVTYTLQSGPGEPIGMGGCGRLPFDPEIKVAPDGQAASTASGLTVDVHVPQEGQLNPTGLADSNVKDIAVTLPEGVTLNPSAADGLQACSEGQIGFEGVEELEPGIETQTFKSQLPGSLGSSETLQPGVNFCPNSSKIATAKIKTPLLPNALEGAVYLAAPQNFQGAPLENPFGSLVAMYVVVEDPISGSLVKIPGRVSLNQQTGRIESTFDNNPQLPFEDAELHFFGGERAPLAIGAHCGTYTTEATFTPWSGGPPVQSTSGFQVTSGPNGAPCPGGALPFDPSLQSGSVNNNAGSFSPLTTTLSRTSGNQPIQSVVLHYPAGLSGLLSTVKLCPEAQANAGTCGPESEIGETIVSVGVGGDPFTVTGGKVYITEKYDGAPFGLSIVNPAKAGPFDLQEGRPIVVRAKIEVDPTTAALTITTNSAAQGYAIPTIVEGFALQIQHVFVNINRPGFTLNPTSCTPTEVSGAIDSSEGAGAPVQVPFQVTNCAALKFEPKLTVSTSGKASRADGASLNVKLTKPDSQGAQADVGKFKIELPKQLPSRLSTLQKACTNAQFQANPAGCPAPSVVGRMKVATPLLPVPLEGPMYFVSHGGEAFPDLEVVL